MLKTAEKTLELEEIGMPYMHESISEFNTIEPETRTNPWPYYKWLFQDPDRSVYKAPNEDNFYVVSGQKEIHEVLLDHRTYSSHLNPLRAEPFFLLKDGKEHTRIRRAFNTMFTPKALEIMGPEIDKIIERFTQDIFKAKKCELMDAWANIIPLNVMSTMLGLPDDRKSLDILLNQTIAFNKAFFPLGGTGDPKTASLSFKGKLEAGWEFAKLLPKIAQLFTLVGWKGVKELKGNFNRAYNDPGTPQANLKAMITSIKPVVDIIVTMSKKVRSMEGKNPGKEMPINFFAEEYKKGKISMIEMIFACELMLFAGHETTASLLTSCFVYLCNNPKKRRELQEDPEKIEAFVEETLRLYAPQLRVTRRVTKDTNLGGKFLKKDTQVVVLLGANNVCPYLFDKAFAFDLDRENASDHSSFGKGVHKCPGEPIARILAVKTFKYLLPKIKEMRLDPDEEIEMISTRGNGQYGYEKLPVIIEEK